MGSNKICGNSLKNSGMDLSNKGFVQSELDKWLFMKSEIICIVYLDDTIIDGPKTKAIEE